MFFPNEIITEILNNMDYLTWKDKVNKINQQYHSYYEYNYTAFTDYKSLCCKRHRWFVVNWRGNAYNNQAVKGYIYPFCVDSDEHKLRWQMISHIKLPKNY